MLGGEPLEALGAFAGQRETHDTVAIWVGVARDQTGGRQMVLQKISSLRGQEPVPGHDELNVQEIHKELAAGDEQLAARVRDYERPRKNRDGVLHAADAQLTKS